MTGERPVWMLQARCADNTLPWDPTRTVPVNELRQWFHSEGAGRTNYAYARRFCAVCPVADECFEYALVNHEHGLWGGSTEEDRRLERGRRTRARKAVA